ncbi:hypothetical protein [Streptomyces sp. NPDC002889]|uniref:hypothetical protein n=1 Tax=Streptomyces sp. NPDC002889 TaxID=3364669 RepID=UPI0036BCADD0
MDSPYDGETTAGRGAVPDLTEAGERHIDVRLLARTRASRGYMEPLPGGRVLLSRTPVTPGGTWRLEVHERESLLRGEVFLLGRSQPLSSLTLPSPSAWPVPDGSFVVTDGTTVWSVAADGSRHWQLTDELRPVGAEWFRVRGTPSVSPDGSLVAVVVSMPVTERSEPSAPVSFVHDGPQPSPSSSDVLLLLDTTSGEVLQRLAVAVESVDSRLLWHPDGALLAVSCWGLWHSWTTHWFEVRRNALHRLGGMTMGEAAAFVPGSSRLLTVRRAEGFALDDDVNALASYDTLTSERLAHVDHGKLLIAPDSVQYADLHPLDATRVILESSRLLGDSSRWESVHWLCDADSLLPLGRLRYPQGPVPPVVRPLGDGTWLTRQGSRVHHWSLS